MNPVQNFWLLPDGIEEVWPDQAERLETLRRAVLELFASWGYRLVNPPLIEFLDTLLTGTGKDLELQTFKIIDQFSGKLLGVRADMTPQVARFNARLEGVFNPRRFCYVGTVLHCQSDRLEQARSPMQFGAELYGDAGSGCDVEIVSLMLEALDLAGLSNPHLDLGHVGIYRTLISHAGLNSTCEATLFEMLQRKDKTGLREFLHAAQLDDRKARMLESLIDLNGPIEIIEKARHCLGGAGDAVLRALADLEAIAGHVGRRFPSVPINFDLAELRGYHYQSGVVFSAFVPGYGREVARGGRYDDLGKAFGQEWPATGFSSDLKLILRLTESSAPECLKGTKIWAPSDSDPDLFNVMRQLRSQGSVVIQELPGQRETASVFGCSAELRKVGGQWKVFP